MKKPIKLIITAAVMCIAVIWCASLVYCEILTAVYRDDFGEAYRQNPMLGNIEYFKVLDCSSHRTARVYYVSEKRTGDDVLNFEYDNDSRQWSMTSWETVWSSSGSADGAVFPYLWHCLYAVLK